MTSTLINRLSSAVVVGIPVVKIFLREGMEGGVIFLLCCLPILSMVWFGPFWAAYILPFGWWGWRRPSDLGSPVYDTIVPLLGWILLIVLCLLVG